jgi:putative phosphoesterase
MNFPITVGIISDTHGFIHLDIVNLINQCDIAIHSGDIVDEKTLLQLKPKQQLIAIQGNNDEHLTQLKKVEKLNISGVNIVVDHGHTHGRKQPSHDLLRCSYPNAKIIIYGHTHKQIIDKTSIPWIINPGAAGKTRNQGSSKCLILTINSEQDWQIISHTFN